MASSYSGKWLAVKGFPIAPRLGGLDIGRKKLGTLTIVGATRLRRRLSISLAT
ncbi:MAG: hypothetical protein ACE5I9_06780 [Candidatus Methylomirabilales bacterium]